ncbi:MAG: NAD(P)H-dependent oxidoreductase [Cellulophaga sp.]|nr:NAD(P)H-dependent oxidoreductase [Cellulophaga sp.]
MATIIAFAGSNSSVSINFKLVKFTADLIENHDVKVINLADYPLPMYSYDEEKNNGYNNLLISLKNEIKNSDGILLAVNEHNGHPSAYFKNVIDWLSRVERNFLADKKIFLMATSGGQRGAISALELVEKLLPRFGGEIVTTFSLPSFNENFDKEKGIIPTKLASIHQKTLDQFISKF